MQKLSRREALRGTGVAALAAGAAIIPAPATAEEPDSRTMVREFARKLLTEADHRRITVAEWVERKRCAVALQALIGDEPEPWTDNELEWMENIESHRWRGGMGS
jgi:hypothetical protein